MFYDTIQNFFLKAVNSFQDITNIFIYPQIITHAFLESKEF